MRVIRVITVGIDIPDPIGFFNDEDNNILTVLKEKYVGICFAKCYILGIRRIIEKSPCRIGYEGNSAIGKLNVIVEVEAEIFPEGSIITKCKIIKKDNNHWVCSGKNTRISVVEIGREFDSMKQHQLIPIIVSTVEYKISAQYIPIIGRPFMYKNSNKYYRITEENIDTTLLSDVLNRINEANKLASELDNNKLNFFKKLFYPFKELQKKPNKVEEFDIISLAQEGRIPVGVYSRDIIIPQYTTTLYRYLDDIKEKEQPLLMSTNVLLIWLEEYYNYLTFLNEMSTIYADKQLFDQHDNLWKIYVKNKLEKKE